jgi:hypothetical protein
MRKINILLAAICVVLISSCSGLLDKKPTNQADSSTTIMNTTDAQVMINGVMSKMLSSSYYGRNFLLWGDGRSGDVTTVSAGNGGDGYYYYNHEVNSNSYEGFWSTMYNDLLQINNIITNLVKLKAESENATTEYDDFLGQAYTLRAMVHFDLVRLYGKPYNMDKGASLGVPVVTEIVNASEQRTRNTVAEVYTQIVKDLLAGAELISKDIGQKMQLKAQQENDLDVKHTDGLKVWDKSEVIDAIDEFMLMHRRIPKQTEFKNENGLPSYGAAGRALEMSPAEYMKERFDEVMAEQQEEAGMGMSM